MAIATIKKPNLVPLQARIATSMYKTMADLSNLNDVSTKPLDAGELTSLEALLNRLVLLERAANVLDAINNPEGENAQLQPPYGSEK